MKVVDASAMIDVLTGAESAEQLIELLDDDLFAPHLLVSEVLHRIRRLLLTGAIDEHHASRLIDALHHADIDYMTITNRIDAMWDLRHNVGAYDAAYVVLADELACPLVSCDRRLANASRLPVTVLGPR